jgi:N utilization substance protein B
MLNRRYLRIKVMQALYSFFQSDDSDIAKGERELLRSIDKVYDLYIYLLLLFNEIRHVAGQQIEDNKTKHLPTKEDLDPNLRFINNRLLNQLAANDRLKKEAEGRKLSWQVDHDVVRKVWSNVKGWDGYQKYMAEANDSYENDQDFILDLFSKHVADSDDVELHIEEKSLYWPGDLNNCVAPAIIKTLEAGKESQAPRIASLYKDADDDQKFLLELFRKTIMEQKNTQEIIGEKTQNWEVDRIAVMDILLMQMALTELLYFREVPVKVTLNEYIEISKLYSTPKSSVFINGILDKLVADFKGNGKLVKTGRGLIE